MDEIQHPWRGLLATAAQLGAYSWVEAQISSMLGSWVIGQAEPADKVDFHARSAQHRWHSELFFERLPVLAVLTPEDLVRPPNEEFESFLSLVKATRSHSDQLVGLDLVLLPYLLGIYRQELATLSDVADGSTKQCLSLVIADLEQELSESGMSPAGGSALQVELERALQSSPGLRPDLSSVTDDT
jgi:hypothetical protein